MIDRRDEIWPNVSSDTFCAGVHALPFLHANARRFGHGCKRLHNRNNTMFAKESPVISTTSGYSTTFYKSRVCTFRPHSWNWRCRARFRPGGLTSQTFHACGSTSLFCACYCHSTAGCLSFHPMAQFVVQPLKGLACSARITPASSPALHCKQCSALTSPAPGLLAHAEVTKI